MHLKNGLSGVSLLHRGGIMANFRRVFASCLVATLAAGSVGFACAQSDSAQKVIKFNIGGPSAGYWNTYIAEDLGLYKKHGLEPNFYWFTSGAPLLAALKSGSIDVVVTGLITVFALGQNIPLKILFWELDNGAGEGLLVREDTGIRSYMDIGKAKAIGVMPGTCSQVALGLIARKAGVDYKKLNTINLAPPLFANAFTGKSIDAATGWAPWSLMPAPGVKVVSWDADYDGVCPSKIAVRPAFIKDNPQLGIRLLRAQQEARELVSKNPKLAIDALQKYLKISEPVAKEFYEKHCCSKMPTIAEQLDPNHPYSMVAKRGGMAKQLHVASEILHETGTIPAALSWETIDAAIDPSVLRAYASEGRSK